MIGMNFRSEPYALGESVTVEFHLKGNAMNVEWAPAMPKPEQGRRLLPAYRRARDEFLALVARQTGKTALCVEV
jgi:hypothetical protein